MIEICLHILWNMLTYPNNIKYYQINSNILYNNLERKCKLLNVNANKLFVNMEYHLKQFGFEKRNDNNWYYNNNVQILQLWELIIYCIKKFNINIKKKKKNRYKTRIAIPKKVYMLDNKKWKEYEIVFDYEYRRIVLFDNSILHIQTLQIGNPKKLSLEFNVYIQYYNDFSEIETNCIKWACLILNNYWHFRMINWIEREDLSNCCSEFNSFHVTWKDYKMAIYKEPFNPYSTTLKQGLQHLTNKLQIIEHFLYGKDELICFECTFNKCKPSIPVIIGEDILLHQIYKHFPHYPIIQVYWEIETEFMIPYDRTILVKSNDVKEYKEMIISNEISKFDPLLFECDFHKLKLINNDLLAIKTSCNSKLKLLLHEVIKNGYLNDLITFEHIDINKKIKQEINFNENNADELIVNDNILTILNEIKKLYHNDIHKHMGYPLQLYHICAILLYCEKECSIEFIYNQIQFRHKKWIWFDICLYECISILNHHERREESEMELYCGLKRVRLENIEKCPKAGYFISYLITSDNLQFEQICRSDQGCILHFHPSMRRAPGIGSCDISWIIPYKKKGEILFSRSIWAYGYDENIYKQFASWNAKIEYEDEKTQTILLTWAVYDQFIDKILQISAIWNHSIDLNLIYLILHRCCSGNINETHDIMSTFQEWMANENNGQKYKARMDQFLERRCCNHYVNLIFIFLEESGKHTAIEIAGKCTITHGLPFVENDKKILPNGKP
ncbi:hypothetical protein RFI_28752 [Reticulomyxa filosa]|uniref:Uncharacterized protein n=1 Tax=Reticulomyxa filosa TaxID=46433 RepID=X6M592_RETFI|nr:hypothetical protein RFI_28752 [Reticulomyxa filosa]|eukprot:ETO08637.1 hypothetical protein RFI_28752 [Reticulomyxa filosa]